MFRSAASVMPAFLRRAGLVAMVCSALTLVGCGGGSRARDYHPDSIVIFGDENSAFANYAFPDSSYTVRGLVYTVNPVTTYTLSQTGVAADTLKICTDNQTPGTLCVTNILENANTRVDGFAITGTDAVNYPYGRVDRQGLDADPNNFNIVNFIAVGTGNEVVTGSPTTTTNKPMKRSLELFYNCNASSTWMQVLAHSFNKGFKQADVNAGCSIDRDGAVSYATVNATIADVQTQVNNNMSSLRSGVLVGVLAGQKDILDVWGSSTWGSQDARLKEVKYRADQLARTVNQILNTGAKVVLIGVPDLGFAPDFAGTSNTCSLGVDTRSDGSALPACNGDLHALVAAFNETVMLGDRELRLDGLKDYASQGRKLAFVDARVQVQNYAVSTGYVNARVCESATGDATKHLMFRPDGAAETPQDIVSSVRFCTNASLVSGGDLSTYIWADGRHLSWPVHGAIGSAAFSQASNQF